MREFLVPIFFVIFLGYLAYLFFDFIKAMVNKEKGGRLKTLRLLISYSVTFFLCYFTLGVMNISVIAPHEVYSHYDTLNYPLINWISSMAIELLLLTILTLCIVFFLSYLYQNKIEKVKSMRPIFTTFTINLFLIIAGTFLLSIHTYWNWIDSIN